MYGKSFILKIFDSIRVPVPIAYWESFSLWLKLIYLLAIILPWIELVVSIVLTVIAFKKKQNKYIKSIAIINWIKLGILFVAKQLMYTFVPLIDWNGIEPRNGLKLFGIAIILFIIQIVLAIIYNKKKKGEDTKCQE